MSNDLISRKALLMQMEITEAIALEDCGRLMAKTMIAITTAQPAVEAEPVKHGHWVFFGSSYFCSECDGSAQDDMNLTPNCPYCRAKMDEEGKIKCLNPEIMLL